MSILHLELGTVAALCRPGVVSLSLSWQYWRAGCLVLTLAAAGCSRLAAFGVMWASASPPVPRRESIAVWGECGGGG